MDSSLTSWRTGIFTLVVGAALCAVASAAHADRPLLDGAGKLVGEVGSTVGSTAKAIGKGVGGTAERVTGTMDVPKVRKEINDNSAKAISRLLKLDKKAKALYDISYGYAVFDSRKSSFVISLGSGGGVAVSKGDGARTYMRMLTGGVNVGAGIQFYQNIFLFEDKRSFDRFVESGWEAGTSANANFGRRSVDAEVRFIDGMALFQLADTGINLSADFTGTKYWKDMQLN